MSGLQDLIAIVRSLVDPLLESTRTYTATVIKDNGDNTLELRPNQPSPFTDMSRVPVRLPAGLSVKVKPQSVVMFGFDNGDRRYPYATLVSITQADTLKIDAQTSVTVLAPVINCGDALGRVLREGDTLSITPGNAAGAVTGIATVTVGLGVPPVKSKVFA